MEKAVVVVVVEAEAVPEAEEEVACMMDSKWGNMWEALGRRFPLS